MSCERHGLTVGIERSGNQFFLSLRAIGKLSHEDYDVITPMIDAALAEVSDARIKALVDARQLQGWEARAAWDDFKLGLKHGKEFEKIAIVGNRKWQENVSRLASWFISGDVRFFDSEEEALDWLN